MSLEDATKQARARADVSTDPVDHRVALALEAALHAERHPAPPPGDTTGIEPPPVSHVVIPKPATDD